MPVQIVVFSISSETYGADIHVVEGIHKMQTITSVPNSPQFVSGVIDIRGSILPVIDLGQRFGVTSSIPEEKRQIILFSLNEMQVAMIVDEIIEVKTLADEIIDPPSNLLATSEESYINGIARDKNRLIVLVDLTKVLSIEEQSSLTNAQLDKITPQEVAKMSGPYTHTNSKGNTYILHARERVLKSGKTSKMYFFAKEAKEGAINAVPEGYVVSETKNGLPVLKKADNA